MTTFIPVPLKKLRKWKAAINTIALQTAFDVADDIAQYTADRWIPVNGEKPDLPKGTLIDVRFSDGIVVAGHSADSWSWVQDGDTDDITHYRIHQPPVGA